MEYLIIKLESGRTIKFPLSSVKEHYIKNEDIPKTQQRTLDKINMINQLIKEGFNRSEICDKLNISTDTYFRLKRKI